jgi:hypothetical protein
MKILENGREIRESCGQMVFLGEEGFLCPCKKCFAARYSRRIEGMRR